MARSYSHTPLRTCVGCGERAAQNELIRFSASAGKLELGESKVGRGAYLHPLEPCWQTALRRSAFARTFRGSIDTSGIELDRILQAQGA
ncbi:MAG: YlxR family protein [Candidatus Nanopelagicales bacterium]